MSLNFKSTEGLPKLSTLSGTTASTTLSTLNALGTTTAGVGLKVATTSGAPPSTIGKGLGGVDVSTTAGAGKTTG